MTELYQCDRCGIMLKNTEKTRLSTYAQDSNDDMKLDLCLNCLIEFKLWMKSGIMVPEDLTV